MHSALQKFITTYSNPSSLPISTLSEKERYVSTLALLLEAARADGDLESKEVTAISGSMFHCFGLEEHQTGEFIEVSDYLLKAPGRLETFISNLNLNANDDEKITLMSMVWKVVQSDGVVEKEESNYARHLRIALGLTLEQAARAAALAHSPK